MFLVSAWSHACDSRSQALLPTSSVFGVGDQNNNMDVMAYSGMLTLNTQRGVFVFTRRDVFHCLGSTPPS